MRDKGVTVLDDAAGADDGSYAQTRGFFYTPSDCLDERLYRDEVDALVAEGWLNASSKIGIYSYNETEDSQVVQDAVEPELARFGLKPAAVEAIDNSAEGASENANVVLQYRARGVDRVIPVLASPLLLMEMANSQHYFPEFSLNSDFGPGALLETAAPAAELAGGAGIGWQPLSDLDSSHQEAPVSSKAALCSQIMVQSGQASSSATVQLFEAQICDVLFFAAAALRTQASISPANMAAGEKAMGTFRSAVTFQVAFPGGRPDGAAVYRDLRYQSSCSCFLYSSANQPA